MAEVGSAWISILPETSKITPGVAKAVGAAEPAVAKQGDSMGSKLGKRMGGALKKTAIGAGVAAGGAIAAGLTKGVGRLNSIEQAQSKLKALGNSGEDVGRIMDNALASVKGTSFGIEEAAGTAATMVASGIKPGEELETVLKGVADSAAVAGVNMDEMGLVWGKAAAKGKIDGQIVNQLLERQIPIYDILGEKMGKTSEEIADMVSKGKVSFEDFSTAMSDYVGGGALEMGNTVQGAFKNMGAAAGRLGATIAGPFFENAAGGFNGVGEALDSMNERVKPVMERFGGWLEKVGIPAAKRFGEDVSNAFSRIANSGAVQGALRGTSDAFVALFEAGKQVAPAVADIAGALGKASAAIGVSGWSAFVSILEMAGTVAQALAGPLQTVADFMQEHPGLVTAAVAAWAGFKTLPAVMSRVTGALGAMKTSMTPAFTSMKHFGESTTEAYGAMRAANPQMGRMGASMAVLAGQGGMLRTAMGGLKASLSGVVTAMGGPLMVGAMALGGVILSQKSAAESTKAAHDAMAESVRDGAAAQSELQAELAGTTGELGEQGLAAAARMAKGEMAEFIEMGGRKFSIKENIDQTTASVDSFLAKIPGLGNETVKASAEAAQATKSQREAYEALEGSLEAVKIPMSDLYDVVAKGGKDFDLLVADLRNSGEAGNAAADQLVAARDKIESFANAARNVDEGFAQASQAVDKLADSASSADDKLAALDQWMVALGLRPKNAEKALMDAAKAVDGIAESAVQAIDGTEGLGSAMFNLEGKLEPTNANAQELSASLDKMYDQLRNVAVNGGDVEKAFANMQPELSKLQDGFQLTDGEMKKLLDSYGLVPDKIETAMALEGADAATQDLAKVAAAIEGSPDKKDIKVLLEDDESRQKLEDLGFKLQDMPDGETKINLEDDEAKAKIAWLLDNEFPKIDVADPTAKANLDDSELLYKTEYAQMQLDTLDLKRPNPLASMDIGQLSAEQQRALQKVGLLNGQKPTPLANMNIDQLSKEQQLALAKVFNLGGQKPTPVANMNKNPLMGEAGAASGRLKQLHGQHTEPKIEANADQVPGAVQGVKNLLGSIKDKVVNIFTRHSDDGGGRYNGGIAGLYTGGRALPAFASGGRLPVSGPGTHTRDGILGVGDDGVPVARVNAGEWVINHKSSQRYHDLLAAINRDDPALDSVMGMLPGYVDGGKVTGKQLDKFARGIEGKPYVWGGVNWGDCSGAQSALANYATGRAPFGSRFATMNQREELLARGFKLGRGSRGDLRMGWFNGGPYGGHTAGTLPNGVNVEMGGGRGNGQYGGPAAGANHSQFTDHAFLPMRDLTVEFSDVDGDYDYGEPVDISGLKRTGQTASISSPSISASSFSSSTSAQGPKSVSEAAGIAASAFAAGQVSDILSVLGLPDGVPAMDAANQARALAKDYSEESEERFASEAEMKKQLTDKEKELAELRSKPLGEGEDRAARGDKITALEKEVVQLRGEVTRTEGMRDSAVGKLLRDAKVDPSVLADPMKRGQAINAISGALEAVTGSGKMPERMTPELRRAVTDALGQVKGFATGGHVRGRGGPKDDDILSWLSNGEYVVNAAATKQNKGLLDAINSGGSIQSMLSAGLDSAISAGAAAANAAAPGSGLAVQLAGMYGKRIAGALPRELSRWADVGIGALTGHTRLPSKLPSSAVSAPSIREQDTQSRGGGNSYTFVAENRSEMMRIARREMAKGRQGKVGAR